MNLLASRWPLKGDIMLASYTYKKQTFFNFRNSIKAARISPLSLLTCDNIENNASISERRENHAMYDLFVYSESFKENECKGPGHKVMYLNKKKIPGT